MKLNNLNILQTWYFKSDIKYNFVIVLNTKRLAKNSQEVTRKTLSIDLEQSWIREKNQQQQWINLN